MAHRSSWITVAFFPHELAALFTNTNGNNVILLYKIAALQGSSWNNRCLPEGKWAYSLGSEERGWLQPPGLAPSPARKALLCIYCFSVTITVVVSTETESAQGRKGRVHLALCGQTVFSQQRREELVTYSLALSACTTIQAGRGYWHPVSLS